MDELLCCQKMTSKRSCFVFLKIQFIGRCILDGTTETVSVNCQSCNFSLLGTCRNHPSLPPGSFSFSFPTYLSLQDDLSQALTPFQMTKILLLLFLYKDLYPLIFHFHCSSLIDLFVLCSVHDIF